MEQTASFLGSLLGDCSKNRPENPAAARFSGRLFHFRQQSAFADIAVAENSAPRPRSGRGTLCKVQTRPMTSRSSVRSSTTMTLLLVCAAESGNIASHAHFVGMTCPAAGKLSVIEVEPLLTWLAVYQANRGCFRCCWCFGSTVEACSTLLPQPAGAAGSDRPILAPAHCWLVGESLLPAGRLNIRRPACHAVHGRVVSGLLNR